MECVPRCKEFVYDLHRIRIFRENIIILLYKGDVQDSKFSKDYTVVTALKIGGGGGGRGQTMAFRVISLGRLAKHNTHN